VVHGLHGELRLPEQPGEAALRVETHVVRDGLQLRRAVHDRGAELVRDVCDEVAAERHVEQLHPAADAEDRHEWPRDRGTRERQLEPISLLRDAVVRVVTVSAVVRRIDVSASRQDEPGDDVETCRLSLDRWQHDGDAARDADRIDVFAGDRERLAFPCPPVARDPDERSHAP